MAGNSVLKRAGTRRRDERHRHAEIVDLVLHPEAEAAAVVKAIRDAGGRAEAATADLAAADGPHKLAAEIRRIVEDRPDILVANAGIANDAPIEDLTVADFEKLFAVNVRAPLFLVQQLLPKLGNGSSVVLLASLAAHASVGMLAAYSATKGAIDTLVKHFAAAFGARGRGGAGQRGCSGHCRYRHVELRQDGCGARFRAWHAGAAARGSAGRHW